MNYNKINAEDKVAFFLLDLMLVNDDYYLLQDSHGFFGVCVLYYKFAEFVK